MDDDDDTQPLLDEDDRPEVEELGGESEYSMTSANIEERSSSRKVARSPATRGAPEPTIEELGRYALEEATEAPIDRPEKMAVVLQFRARGG